ncbi:SAM-dependent methyltransferase [Flavobacterium cyanobacteriorum]|uniref:SAM-dependent methyltransferase n=1 Tax=Flavobacterium cyanobacteriorum TaxID=2022802 RepID=A0A255YZP4_9FLAO|nr:class I SAM-dependent methyltransferase [Flavobacterium cyanobacteriorum]OYQ34686.1 SAM-dependent methyltransferase [Flavobacterium cyanobacteriorum]
MNIIDRFHNWRRKLRWNKQYRRGRWESLKTGKELTRYTTIIRYLTDYGKQNPSILDIGCGEGVLNEKLPKDYTYSYFLGIDFSKVSIEKAILKNFPNAEFQCRDIHNFNPERKFDVIVFNEVFYYIHEKERMNVLQKMISHLEDNGIIIASIYREAPHLWKFFDDTLENINFVTVRTEEELRYWQIGVYCKKGCKENITQMVGSSQ